MTCNTLIFWNVEDTIDYIVETIAENFSNKVDDSYDPISWAEKEKDAEKEGIPCCGHIKISSSGRVREMYPFILGDYKQIESKSPQTIYVKPAKKPMFLTQPENTGLGLYLGCKPISRGQVGIY
jgi:hypothetical protein